MHNLSRIGHHLGFTNRDIDFKVVRISNKIQSDKLNSEPIYVDYAVPSSYSVLIHTSNCAIAYIGGFRENSAKL